MQWTRSSFTIKSFLLKILIFIFVIRINRSTAITEKICTNHYLVNLKKANT